MLLHTLHTPELGKAVHAYHTLYTPHIGPGRCALITHFTHITVGQGGVRLSHTLHTPAVGQGVRAYHTLYTPHSGPGGGHTDIDSSRHRWVTAL